MRYSYILTVNAVLLASFFYCTSLFAIDDYKNGDTVYVWAFSGLTLRQNGSLDAPKIRTVLYGTALIVLDQKFNNTENHVTVEAVPGFKGAEGMCPAILISGRFVRIVLDRDTGYVFDGYLSKLPAFRYLTDKKMDNKPHFEDIGEWAKRNFGLASTFRETYDGAGTHSKNVYRNGILVEAWTSKSGVQRTIVPNVSFEESFMILNFMSGYEWGIRNQSKHPYDTLWQFNQQGNPILDDITWNFGHGACTFRIIYLKAGQIAVITRECSC